MATRLLLVSTRGTKKKESKGGGGGMDCCICSPTASVYRLPRNSICAPCHEGAKAVIAFLNKDGERQEEDGGSALKSRGSMVKPDSTTKGMRDAWEQVKEMRGREEEAHRRAAFLAQGLEGGTPHRHRRQTGHWAPNTGPQSRPGKRVAFLPMHALHAGLMHARRPRGRRCSATCWPPTSAARPPPATPSPSRSWPTTSYPSCSPSSTRASWRATRQLHALLVAADKYDVPFLRRACEARLDAALDASNALRTLEVADLSSSAALRERAMGTVVEHAEQVVFSPEYDDLAARNAGLCVDITRALLARMSMTRNKASCTGDTPI